MVFQPRWPYDTTYNSAYFHQKTKWVPLCLEIVCVVSAVTRLLSSSETLTQCDSPPHKTCTFIRPLSSSFVPVLPSHRDLSLPEVLGSICLPCWWTFLAGAIQTSVHLRPCHLVLGDELDRKLWAGEKGWGLMLGQDAWWAKDGTEEVSKRQMGARGLSGGKFGRGNRDVNTEASSSTRHRGNLTN